MKSYTAIEVHLRDVGAPRRLFAMLAMVGIYGCSRPARPAVMAPAPSHNLEIATAYGRLAVGDVVGGKATGFMAAKVSNDEFRDALMHTLSGAGILADDSLNAAARIDVRLLEMRQPSSPLPPAKVTSVVEYRVSSHTTGATLATFVVESQGRAGLTDAILGMDRLRLANEAAVRSNLTCLLQRLARAIAASPPAGDGLCRTRLQ